jgi:hypothetical protein
MQDKLIDDQVQTCTMMYDTVDTSQTIDSFLVLPLAKLNIMYELLIFSFEAPMMTPQIHQKPFSHQAQDCQDHLQGRIPFSQDALCL